MCECADVRMCKCGVLGKKMGKVGSMGKVGRMGKMGIVGKMGKVG